MLPFGSLLTQLPLIIIGALYMLYLGFYAINRTKEEPLADYTEKKERVIESKTPIHEADYFKLVSLIQEKDTEALTSEYTFHFIVNCSNLSYQVSDFETVSFYSCFSLFSRPPPAFA